MNNYNWIQRGFKHTYNNGTTLLGKVYPQINEKGEEVWRWVAYNGQNPPPNSWAATLNQAKKAVEVLVNND